MTLHYIDMFPKSNLPKPDHTEKKLGELPYIHPSAVIHESQIGSWTEIGENTLISESSFDDYSYIAGDGQIIYAKIGKFCSIASHVRINPGNHPMERVTQHHMTYRRKLFGFGEDDAEFFEWRRAHQCVIGHDVWIGHNATIMPGVEIGTGAVIGAGAVVTKNVEPYSIVAGVPAKPIRKRFSDDVIEKLLRIAWWDWDRSLLEQRFDDFLDLQRFVERYG